MILSLTQDIMGYMRPQLLSLLLLLLLLSGCSLVAPDRWGSNVCPAPEVIELPAEAAQCPAPQVVERVVTKLIPAALPPMATTAGKMHLPIVGAVEWVKVEPSNLVLESRIDTGADTTSIHAEDIQLIEKDGRRYVQFVLLDPSNGARHPQELRLRRRVIIKQNNGPDDRRYVVRMWLTLGASRARVDVNLSDRTDFEYPLLIGRNFLTDSLIVDVSRHHSMGR